MHEGSEDLRHEELWKAQEEEAVQMSLGQVCMRARKLEKSSMYVYWFLLTVLAFLTAVMTVYLVHFSDPLLRVGLALIISALAYMIWQVRRNGPPRRLRAGQPDACVDFLRSELKRRHQGLVEKRCFGWLLLPGMLIFWWGGGPTAVSIWRGVDSPGMTQYQQSSTSMVVVLLVFVAAWVLLEVGVRRLQRAINELENEPLRSKESR